MFKGFVWTLLKAVPNPAGKFNKSEPSPTNFEAVIIPDAFIWFISNPAECKFCVWNCKPWVWPSVSAVPTLIILLLSVHALSKYKHFF